jgi:transcriptional regulator with XRE-family HTH domain
MQITHEIKVSFGIRLKQLINDKKMTQEKLAELVGVTPNSVSGWITGKSPLKQNKELILNTIANEFDVDVDYLVCKQVEKRKKELNFNDIDTHKAFEEFKRFELYKKFLKLSNIDIEIISEPIGEQVEGQDILDGKIITYTYYEESKESIAVTYEGKTKLLEVEEFENFMDNILLFTKFSVTQLLSEDK